MYSVYQSTSSSLKVSPCALPCHIFSTDTRLVVGVLLVEIKTSKSSFGVSCLSVTVWDQRSFGALALTKSVKKKKNYKIPWIQKKSANRGRQTTKSLEYGKCLETFRIQGIFCFSHLKTLSVFKGFCSFFCFYVQILSSQLFGVTSQCHSLGDSGILLNTVV